MQKLESIVFLLIKTVKNLDHWAKHLFGRIIVNAKTVVVINVDNFISSLFNIF